MFQTQVSFNVEVEVAGALPTLRRLRAAYARHLVEELGFSQAVAASIMGVTPAYISTLLKEAKSWTPSK